MYSSVVEPEPPFLSGAGALKKEADPAPATALTYTLKNEINKNLKNLINCYAPVKYWKSNAKQSYLSVNKTSPLEIQEVQYF